MFYYFILFMFLLVKEITVLALWPVNFYRFLLLKSELKMRALSRKGYIDHRARAQFFPLISALLFKSDVMCNCFT
jgi:hypothetical protein